MPVRSPALCRPTVPQPAATLPPPTAVRISDSILRRDLGRRTVAPAPGSRCLSSRPGPLESRRRLGRRHMAGLMPSTPSHLPLWHFNVAAIPDAWQWEPATTQHERRTRDRSLTLSGLFSRLIRWLEKSDADKPFLQPPPPDDLVGSAAQPAPAGSAIGDAPVSLEDEYPGDYPVEVVKMRTNIALLDELDDDALHRLCKTCRRSLQRRIIRRQISTEGLLDALEPFDPATLSRISDRKLAGKFAAMIRRTILAGMIEVQREDPYAPLDHLWLAYAAWICASHGGHSNTQLFWRLMQGIPDSARDRIPSSQLLQLARAFITAQANRHNIFAHWVARAQNFSDIYGGLSDPQRARLDADVLAFLEEAEDGQSDAAASRQRRFSWLVVQAFDKRTSNEALSTSYHRLISGQGSQPHSSLQLWQLMVGRAYASGGIPDQDLSELTAIDASSMRHRWAALIQAVLRAPDGAAQLQQLCDCLSRMKELETAACALLSSRGHFVALDCVRALAVASGDHRFALRLHAALEAKGVAEPLVRQTFSWDVWAPFVRAMIQDAQLAPPPPISRLLGLTTCDSRPPAAEEVVAAKVELLDRMGHWYMQTRHLKERQLLRRIGECAAIQRALMDSVSPATLANLARVIVMDLDKGKWGRTTRLEWLLTLVAQVQGEKEAMSAARVLKGWRSMIDRRR